MEIISAREFRTKQTALLTKAKKGESILISSRVGVFKIVPISQEDTLTTRICEGLKEVKLIETGQLPAKSAIDFLNEL